MKFNEAIELLRDGEYVAVQVTNTEGKKILDCEGTNPETLILKLEKFKNQLQSYGRIKLRAATEAIKRLNWRDAYYWDIDFYGDHSNNSPGLEIKPFSHGLGFVSQNEAALMSQLEGLKKEVEYNKRFDDLHKKLDEKSNESFEKYLPLMPLLGLFMDINPIKLQQMATMSSMAGAMKQSPGIAGLIPTDQKAIVKGTKEEQQILNSINDNLEKLSEKTSIENIEQFLRTLNEKPQFLTMLMDMAANFK